MKKKKKNATSFDPRNNFFRLITFFLVEYKRHVELGENTKTVGADEGNGEKLY